MGDVVEFTTGPTDQKSWYKITSSSLRFEVKSIASVAIGLAKKPGLFTYWVYIGDHHNTVSYIADRKGVTGRQYPTPNILSRNEYRAFWMTWSNDTVHVGRDGEEKPIFSSHDKAYKNHNENIQYVTFYVLSHSQRLPVRWNASWRVELPPQLPPPCARPISGGKLKWRRRGTHQLPNDALIGGFEKEPLYIIRMELYGSLTPGKFVPSEGLGYASWCGRTHSSGDVKVLCGFDAIWVPTTHDRIPVGAVVGGSTGSAHRCQMSGPGQDGAENLYVGRAYHNGHLIPGMVQLSHKCCYIPFEGKEIVKKRYEILVDPNDNSRSLELFVPPYGLLYPRKDDEADSDLDSGGSRPQSPNENM